MDLAGLNEAQRAAVTAPGGPHLVVAGAGTGKTRTLVHRVAWLIEQGVEPKEIVLLTFTRRAAGEMLDRVAGLVGGPARRVRGGTFHGFAMTALRRYADRVGYDRRFTVLDSSDADALVAMIRTELGLGGRGNPFARAATIRRVISKSINTSRSIEDLLEEEYPQHAVDAEVFEEIGTRYAARKQSAAVVDFDDLLVLLARLLRDDEPARRRLSGEARHVLVDEYQDTNRIQGQIAGLLSVEHHNLMVVGDEAQSIYGFRGALVENILEFPRMFDDTTVTVLEQNYRSIQPILDLANAVLEASEETYDKQLRSDVPGEDLPVVVAVDDDDVQAEVVVRQVAARAAKGIPLREQAVLFRSAFHANLLEIRLRGAGIPYRKFGGIRFTEAAHVKDVLALLRLVANPRDVLAWIRALRWIDGIGAKTSDSIARKVSGLPVPVLAPDLWRDRKYHPGLVALAQLLSHAGAAADDVVECTALVLEWYRGRLPNMYEDHVKRSKDLDAIETLATTFPTLVEMLASVTLDPADSDPAASEGPDDFLTLSTIHSAKGLEWDVVYMLSMSNGSFPSGYSLESESLMEEERRLFYVAITRARRHLYLLRPRFLRGRYVVVPGCALLDEIEELMDLVDEASAGFDGALAAPHTPAAAGRLARLMDWYDD